MIDHASDLKLQHLVELSKLGDACAGIEEGLRRILADRDVVFAGHTIPFVLMPHFVSPGQLRRIRRAVECLSAVLDRFCAAYPSDSRLRAELALDETEDALARLDPGYPGAVRVCRLDAFLAGHDVRFLEFNADSPAGIGYTDVLHRALEEAIALPAVRDTFDTVYEPMLPRLVDTLLDAYAHARAPDMPERPTLALIDVPGSPSVPEFRISCTAAHGAGLNALHATTDELEYDGTTLRAAGEPVHLVHRRALYEDLDPAGALIHAARDHRVVLVNPLRSRVANNKKLFALLQDPRFADLVSRQEAEVIGATIPWTRVLRPGRVRYGEWVVDLLGFVADNRERLVLKPASDHGGRGVMLGIETPQADWEAAVEEHAGSEDFVVQEYVPVPEEMFPVVSAGHVEMRLKRFNINPFAIGGRYAGTITRISDHAVINVSAGGGLLPCVVGRHKRRLLAEEEPEEALHETHA